MSRRLHVTGEFLACVLVLACSPILAEEDGAGGEAVLNGSVVDEAERPIAGVAVPALTYGQTSGHRAVATTGTDGTFRLALGVPARDRIFAVLLAEAKDGLLGYTSTIPEKPGIDTAPGNDARAWSSASASSDSSAASHPYYPKP
jgi:hypothetical protein